MKIRFNSSHLVLVLGCIGPCGSAEEPQVPAPPMVPPEMFTVPIAAFLKN